jgi:hypothetical protein
MSPQQLGMVPRHAGMFQDEVVVQAAPDGEQRALEWIRAVGRGKHEALARRHGSLQVFNVEHLGELRRARGHRRVGQRRVDQDVARAGRRVGLEHHTRPPHERPVAAFGHLAQVGFQLGGQGGLERGEGLERARIETNTIAVGHEDFAGGERLAVVHRARQALGDLDRLQVTTKQARKGRLDPPLGQLLESGQATHILLLASVTGDVCCDYNVLASPPSSARGRRTCAPGPQPRPSPRAATGRNRNIPAGRNGVTSHRL